jgi:hypothetical protein
MVKITLAKTGSGGTDMSVKHQHSLAFSEATILRRTG